MHNGYMDNKNLLTAIESVTRNIKSLNARTKEGRTKDLLIMEAIGKLRLLLEITDMSDDFHWECYQLIKSHNPHNS